MSWRVPELYAGICLHVKRRTSAVHVYWTGRRRRQPDEEVLEGLHLAHYRSDPAHYARNLVYAAPDASLSLYALVWSPGQWTPVHDHCCWGVVGVLEGVLEERSYVRTSRLEGGRGHVVEMQADRTRSLRRNARDVDVVGVRHEAGDCAALQEDDAATHELDAFVGPAFRRASARLPDALRKYGLGAFQPSGKSFFASSSDTEPAMITSSPCFQLTGVATLYFAVICIESSTRRISSKLRPVVIG
jgi:hypothetical protein